MVAVMVRSTVLGIKVSLCPLILVGAGGILTNFGGLSAGNRRLQRLGNGISGLRVRRCHRSDGGNGRGSCHLALVVCKVRRISKGSPRAPSPAFSFALPHGLARIPNTETCGSGRGRGVIRSSGGRPTCRVVAGGRRGNRGTIEARHLPICRRPDYGRADDNCWPLGVVCHCSRPALAGCGDRPRDEDKRLRLLQGRCDSCVPVSHSGPTA